VPIATVTIVVDASAMAAVLFDEEASGAVQQRIAMRTLVAPALLAVEIANVCVMRQRRYGEKVSAASTYAIFDGWNIGLLAVPHSEVVGLALATGLTAYDASYLWLARHLGCELVTLDRRLALAASAIR
jgi:predicted nucleic acid-binding protein